MVICSVENGLYRHNIRNFGDGNSSLRSSLHHEASDRQKKISAMASQESADSDRAAGPTSNARQGEVLPGNNASNGSQYPASEQQQQNRQSADAESDVDELVDSDAEEEISGNGAIAGKGRVGRPRGSRNGAKASKKASANSSNRNGQDLTAAEIETREDDGKPLNGHSAADNPNSRPNSKPSSRTGSPIRGVQSARESHHLPSVDGKTSNPAPRATSSSREMLGRTATGGAVPYYYPQSQAPSGRPSHSPQQSGYGKVRTVTNALKPQPGAKIENSSTEMEDLTPQEVDKFLDLIEKYNLDTTNEDDMARSVTELYQEWLEWCAKRNVVSTKSKQALVGEFVRIHHGVYGTARQQRAMEIVQGSRSFDHADIANAAFDRAANGANSRPAQRNAGVAPDKKKIARPNDVYVSPPRAASGPYNVTSPSSNKRHMTPAYDDHFDRGIPPSVLDSIHQTIRDEVLREAGVMVQQILQENFSELAAENHAMARRIEQLELHSDNLAQWVQHLNRVQEEAAAQPRFPIQDGPAFARDDIPGDPRAAREPYHPAYGRQEYAAGGASYGPNSPKRSYETASAMRGRSISPVPRSSGRAPGPPGHAMHPELYERPGAPAAMPMTGPPPPVAMSGPPPPPVAGGSYRQSPRVPQAYAMPGHGPMVPPYGDGIRGGPPPPPGGGGRGVYHDGPMYDQRGPPPPPHAYDHGPPIHAGRPPSPPLSDSRQVKRARNGY